MRFISTPRLPRPLVVGGALAAGLLAGCSGTAPTSLKRPADPTAVVTLAQPFVFAKTAVLSSVRWQHTLSYGVYRARGHDGNGTYYQGPPGCLQSLLLEGSWVFNDGAAGNLKTRTDCGIYVPFQNGARPQVYVTLTGPSAQLEPNGGAQLARPPATRAGVEIGSVLVNVMVEAERGRLMMARDQPDGDALREALAAGAPKF